MYTSIHERQFADSIYKMVFEKADSDRKIVPGELGERLRKEKYDLSEFSSQELDYIYDCVEVYLRGRK